MASNFVLILEEGKSAVGLGCYQNFVVEKDGGMFEARDRRGGAVKNRAKVLATGNCAPETGCQVLCLEAGPGDRSRAAVYAHGAGNRRRIKADVSKVACGAVETNQLLLNSTGTHPSDGLANRSGLVGRNFMQTLLLNCHGIRAGILGGGLPRPQLLVSQPRRDGCQHFSELRRREATSRTVRALVLRAAEHEAGTERGPSWFNPSKVAFFDQGLFCAAFSRERNLPR